MTKEQKEQLLKELMTRREAEQFLGITSVAFQHHLRVGRIKPCKEYGHGSGKVQLFWKDDLDNLKNFLNNS